VKLLTITDLHGNADMLAKILAAMPAVDAVLLGGDLTNFGEPDDAQRLIRMAQAGGKPVWAVAGNCDSPQIDRRLVELGVSLDGRAVVVRDIGLHGLSGMPPWRQGMYQFTEEELAHRLETGYGELASQASGNAWSHHVVLSHAPPRGAVDRTRTFQHVGSTALRAFIDQRHPALVLCGHIHEGRGTCQIGSTLVVNCGAATAGFYCLAEIGSAGSPMATIGRAQ
jgi:uncharacterized protein